MIEIIVIMEVMFLTDMFNDLSLKQNTSIIDTIFSWGNQFSTQQPIH